MDNQEIDQGKIISLCLKRECRLSVRHFGMEGISLFP